METQSSSGSGLMTGCNLSLEVRTLSWNVRGFFMKGREHWSRLKNMLHEWRSDIVCVQETKMELINKRIVRTLWEAHLWIGCIWEHWAW